MKQGWMYGDVEGVRRAGRRALAHAERLRDEATIAASMADVAWVSDGADRWRAELEQVVARVHRDADAAEQLADALFAHADAAERTLAAITSAMAAFERGVDEARRVLAQATEDVSEAAVDSARSVVEAARWAPPPLSLRWLSR